MVSVGDNIYLNADDSSSLPSLAPLELSRSDPIGRGSPPLREYTFFVLPLGSSSGYTQVIRSYHRGIPDCVLFTPPSLIAVYEYLQKISYGFFIPS